MAPSSSCSESSKCKLVAKDQRCFSLEGSRKRVYVQLPMWQKYCQLPGNISQSWLVQLENEHLQCAACRYSLQKKYQQGQPHSLVLAPKNFELQQKLASEEGMPISRWTRLQTLKQHQKQKCHKLNAINFVRDTHPEVAVDGIASPIEDFRHLLQNIKQRKLKKSETYGKRKKLRKMMYCIAEAHRRYKHSVFATTSQASIMQDGASGKLFARFSCCDNKLQRYGGHLGIYDLVTQHKTADSVAVAQSMVSIVTQACTEWFGAPFKSDEWKKDNEKVNEEARDNFRQAVSQLIADGASDEARARELVSDEIKEDIIQQLPLLNLERIHQYFPKAQVHTIDKAHSGKRMLSRLFSGIPQLLDVLDMCVKKKWSPAKLIHNSDQFQEQFSDLMVGEQIWRHHKLKDLGMSAQKFNSVGRPLVRGTLAFHPVCQAMQQIWGVRGASSKEGKFAEQWAQWLEPKHAILHGFMADAATETVKLIREWEPEDMDMATGYMENAWQLLQTVHVLFKEKKVLEYLTYGAYMIEKLRQTDIVFVFCDGTSKHIYSSDITEELIAECLDTMGFWVDMLEAAVRAECPTWELLQAFQCLSLSEKGKEVEKADAEGIRCVEELDDDATDSAPLYSKHIARLADLVESDVPVLRGEIELVRPLARRYYELGDGINQRSSWGKAVHQRLQWQKRQHAASAASMGKDADGNPLELHGTQIYDYTAIKKVMECYTAWGISTCGVERQIGDYRHIFGKHKNSSDIQKINDEIECSYIFEKDEVSMCTHAAHLYIQAYGTERARRVKLRCDFGTSRCHTLPANIAPVIDGAPQSWRVHQTTGAQVYRTRAASVRKMVQAGTTTITDVISKIALESSSTEQAAKRFNSTDELAFQYHKFAKALQDKFRRERKRGQPLEIRKNHQRRVTALCRGSGIRKAQVVDPKADQKLMLVSWKRRNAMRSSKNSILNLLQGHHGHTQAWGMCDGSDADHAFDDDNNVDSKNFWMFNKVSRVDMQSGQIPGFTELALDVPKIVIVHEIKSIPYWLQMYVYLGGCFLMSTQCFTTSGKDGFCLKHVPKVNKGKKFLYMSNKFRHKFSKMAVAIDTMIKHTPFTKWKILPETKKDMIIDKIRASTARALANGKKIPNPSRNLWLVTQEEKEDYTGISLVMNVPLFISFAGCIDKNLTLMGICGR